METVLLTGGTGLIGTSLTELLLTSGYKVIILSRSPKPPAENLSYALWDVKNARIDEQAIATADHIIHLAGANVGDKRWTAKRKKEIVDSRVDSGKLLVNTLKKVNHHVKTFVCSSAIGWYGPDPKQTSRRPPSGTALASKDQRGAFVETDPPSDDFLGKTCQLWEESVSELTQMNIRLVFIRTGIVLSRTAGAFPEFEKPMKAGLAAILGDGKQIISWIHLDDISRMYLHAIINKTMQGPYNAVSPEKVLNKDLTLALARARKRPFIPIHVPAFALKIILGEMSIEVLKSTTVDNGRIRNTGFNYLYPSVDSALNVLLTPGAK